MTILVAGGAGYIGSHTVKELVREGFDVLVLDNFSSGRPDLIGSHKLVNVHFWCHLLGGIGMGAFMGMAGLKGMLRRSLYINGEFNIYMILAAISGTLLLIGFLAFFYNIVMSVGLKGVIGIFTPAKIKTKDLVPAS